MLKRSLVLLPASGVLFSQLAYAGLDNTVSARFSRGDAEMYQQEIRLDSELEYALDENWVLQGRSRLQLDGKDQLHASHHNFGVRELFVQRQWQEWQWKLGKQIHNWTQMDNLISFEQLSPRDYHEFILPNYADSARGQWMLSAHKQTEQGQWQFLIVPEAKAHHLPSTNDWYQFRAPRLRYGFDYVEGRQGANTEYENIDKGLVAARYERFEQQWQWAVQFRYGLDFEPLAANRFSQNGVPEGLTLYHENRLSIGASASGNIGDMVLRGEMSFSPDRHFNLNQQGLLSTAESDQLSAAIGLDVWGPFDTFINVQVLWDSVLDASDGLVRPDEDVLWSTTIRRSFLNDEAQLEVRWYGSDQEDGLVRASLTYLVSDSHEVKMGIDHFYGDEQGYFGQYDQLDRLYIHSTWFF